VAAHKRRNGRTFLVRQWQKVDNAAALMSSDWMRRTRWQEIAGRRTSGSLLLSGLAEVEAGCARQTRVQCSSRSSRASRDQQPRTASSRIAVISAQVSVNVCPLEALIPSG